MGLRNLFKRYKAYENKELERRRIRNIQRKEENKIKNKGQLKRDLIKVKNSFNPEAYLEAVGMSEK